MISVNRPSLQHWGILGMKWGVRRYRNYDGTLTEAGKKRYSDDDYDFGDDNPNVSWKQERKARLDKKNAIRSARKAEKRAKFVKSGVHKKIDVSKLTDDELRRINNRLKMELEYKTIFDKLYKKEPNKLMMKLGDIALNNIEKMLTIKSDDGSKKKESKKEDKKEQNQNNGSGSNNKPSSGQKVAERIVNQNANVPVASSSEGGAAAIGAYADYLNRLDQEYYMYYR